MADQRTPAGMQDYREYMTHELCNAMRPIIQTSQESFAIVELLKLIAQLTATLDDNPTDLIVIDTVKEIARNSVDD